MARNIDFPINKCPYCEGGMIEIRQYIHGYGTYYVDLETGEVEGTNLHDYLNYRNTSKYARCADCGKKLFKVDDNLNVIE